MRYLLILLFQLFHFSPFRLQENRINIEHVPVKKVYKGYGSKTIKVLRGYGISDIQIAIILAEHGGELPSNNNVGNIRYTSGYPSYSSLEEGIAKQTSVLKKRYKNCFVKDPLQTIRNIQKRGYSPKKEWVTRVYAWYCALQGDASKLQKLN